LDKKVRASFLTNQKLNQNQSWLARTRFPALDASYLSLLQFLIGLFCFFVPVVIGWSNYFGFGFTTLI